jgi:hypothetical protein
MRISRARPTRIVIAAFDAIAEAEKWMLGETLEKAVEALTAVAFQPAGLTTSLTT